MLMQSQPYGSIYNPRRTHPPHISRAIARPAGKHHQAYFTSKKGQEGEEEVKKMYMICKNEASGGSQAMDIGLALARADLYKIALMYSSFAFESGSLFLIISSLDYYLLETL